VIPVIRPKSRAVVSESVTDSFSLSNWLSQIVSVTLVNLRTIPERKGASVTAAVGIAGVVAVFIGVLSIAEGFKAAMKVTGAEDVAIVLRSSADSEMTSGLSREETRLVADAPGVARTAGGPLTSAELFVIINLPKRSTGMDANVPFRGVGNAATKVRDDVRIIEGRAFEPGKNEVIVGSGAARSFAGLEVGKKLRIGQNEWTVVGTFSGGGGAAETEMWTDAAVLQPAYNRGDSFQSVYAKLSSPQMFEQFKNALTTNPQLKVKAMRQSEFLADQSSMLTGFIETIGVGIAVLMALGALFGALNTMYSAVAARTREIATLRALGFGSSPVILSVLFESLALALIGGGIGAAAAYLAFDGFKTATINWQTFSQVAFAFDVTPQLLITAIICASLLGLLGGVFPAIRAARLPIAAALRET
jgi:putative ABC transport system permease protein